MTRSLQAFRYLFGAFFGGTTRRCDLRPFTLLIERTFDAARSASC